ncbi:RuvC-like resolvase [Gordonia phage Evaa]|nr:RuvC-like resolvase [Gordonia phage Evaa]
MPRILAIDPSLTSTGIARIDRDATGNRWSADLYCIKSKPNGNTMQATHRRIAAILHEVRKELDRMPQAVAMEAPAFASNSGSAMSRSWLWGRIYDAAAGLGVPIYVVTTNQRMKYATGKGNTGKDGVLAAAIHQWPDVGIKGNDEADALIVGAVTCRAIGLPIDTWPAGHYPFLDKVQHS